MRENLRSSTRAMVWIRSVLARPGTPTIRLLPPTNSVSSTWLMMSSWPTISFLSSVMIWSRPTFIRSASATSSGVFISIVSKTAPFASSAHCAHCAHRAQCAPSVGHGINDVINTEFVCLIRQIHGEIARVREFPQLAQIVIVVGDREQAFSRVIVLEDAVPLRDAIKPWHIIQRIDFEKRMKNRMAGVEPLE